MKMGFVREEYLENSEREKRRRCSMWLQMTEVTIPSPYTPLFIIF